MSGERRARLPELHFNTFWRKWQFAFHPLFYLLTRREQVTVFRLRTGHNRLSYHLYSKLRIGHTEQCPCGTGSQTSAIQNSALVVLAVRSTAVLPYLRATQKGNLARPHSRSPQAVHKPEGPAMHCHLHQGDWSFHLTNEKKILCLQ